MSRTSRRHCLSASLRMALALLLSATVHRGVLSQETAAPASADERAERLKQSTELKAQAESLRSEHKLDEALAATGKALEIERDLFGPGAAQIADTLALLARICERRGDWDAAAKARDEVLDTRLKKFGPDHWRTADARRALEYTATLRGMDAETRSEIWAADDLDDQVARLVAQKKFDSAVKLAARAAGRRTKVLGATHWQSAEGLHRLGLLHSMNALWELMWSVNAQALAIRQRALGETHPDTGWSWFNLGQALSNLGEPKAAREAFENAVSIWRGALGNEDALTDMGMSRLAGFLQSQKDLAGARDVYTALLAMRRMTRGVEHPETANVHFDLGRVNSSLGDERSARLHYQEALTIFRKALPVDQLAIANSLNNLGLVQNHLRDFAAAKASHEEALTIRRKALPVDHSDIAASLTNLGDVQRELGEFVAAKKSLEEALTIHRRALSVDDPEIAGSLNNLGLVHHDLRDLAAAKKSHEEALTIRRKALPRDHPAIANSLHNLGLVQHALHDNQGAKKSHEEALAIRRKALAVDDPDIANSLNNLGAVQLDLRDYEEAKKSFEAALCIQRKALPLDHSDIARSLNNLGIVQSRQGDYPAARKSYEEALAIRRRALAVDHLDIAISLHHLGVLQYDLRELAAAKKSFEEALTIERKALSVDDPEIARNLNNLGLVQRALHDYEGARKSHEETLTILRKALPVDHPDIASSLNNLGVVQWLLREYAAAKKSYEEALTILKRALYQEDLLIYRSLVNLGNVQRDLREYGAAKRSMEEGLAFERRVLREDDPEIAKTLWSLGRLSMESGLGLRDTVPVLAEAIDLLLTHQFHVSIAQAEREQFDTAETTKLCLSFLLSAAIRANDDPGSAYGRVVRVKGSVTAHQSWLRRTREGADPETAILLDRFRAITRQLAGLAVTGSTFGESGGPSDKASLLRGLSDERARLERQLSERNEAFRSFQSRSRVGSNEVWAALPMGVALIDIVDYLHWEAAVPGQKLSSPERRVVAFVVRPGQQNLIMVPLGLSKELAGLIARWRTNYGAGKAPPAGSQDPGAELRMRLWEPLAQHLGGVKTVLISPDGPLHGLPWGALPGSKEGSFLIHEYAFAVVPVPQLLPEMMKASPRPAREQPSLLLAGGISFGEEKARDAAARDDKLPPVPMFGPLAGTESEVNDLRSQFEDAFPDARAPKVLRKDKATKQAVLAALPSHRFAHLATHGFFAAESEKSAVELAQRAELLLGGLRLNDEAVGRHPGLLSGVVFAGVNLLERKPEETILTALEAAELDLGKVELVVLSACETGRGQVADGEGVLGLQRAFQLAGARSVVASLWRVPDEETHQLMREFYRRVWSDKPVSKAEALRQAQLWMLENWKPRGVLERPATQGPPPPYVWAAFVLSGDWR